MGIGVLSGITIPQMALIINLLGLPGLIAIFWYVDSRRFASQQAQTQVVINDYNKKIDTILKRYKEDVEKTTHYYERNVELVERYEKLSDELSQIIHLNTQVQTRLVEHIENNMFCPVIRKAGPKGM